MSTTSMRPRNELQVGSPALEVWGKKKPLAGHSADFLHNSSVSGCSPRDLQPHSLPLYTHSRLLMCLLWGPVGKPPRNLFKKRTRGIAQWWVPCLVCCMSCI